MPLCGGLIYCLVGACLEASFVLVLWPSVCVVVGMPYFMMLSFSVLSGGRRIFSRALGVVICVYHMWLLILVCARLVV